EPASAPVGTITSGLRSSRTSKGSDRQCAGSARLWKGPGAAPKPPPAADRESARRPERRLCRRPGTWSHVVADVGVRLGSVATRNRDVELGVAPHAVLGHVEAARF